MGDHAHVCFILKIILNLNMIGRIGYMSYTLILLLFQLVSLDSFNWYQFWPFLYTHICLYVCMLSFHIVSISIDIKFFIHIYFVYAKLELQLCFNWFNFQLVSYYKLMHVFCWYFIKGEKIWFSYFNWYFVPLLYDRK